ncbi:MAG: SUMF1/EgtB/PvdO family nonheme iron enzyme [Candidatus Cloacimonadia bacterium]
MSIVVDSFSDYKDEVLVTIKSQPSNAEVYLDGVYRGVTDAQCWLFPGEYSLELKKTEYCGHQDKIIVMAGQDDTHVFNLTMRAGSIIFDVKPDDAKVVLSRNGQVVLKWSGSKTITDLFVGDYNMTVYMPGYKRLMQCLTLKKNEVLYKDVYLERSPMVFGNFVFVEGGSFRMGDDFERYDQKPTHLVALNGFYISKYQLTQKEWFDVMGNNPSKHQGDNLPVENVSWYDIIDYCNKRSVKEGLTPCYSIDGGTNPSDWSSGGKVECDWIANGYRLPTEAEWEYAAQGGNKNKYCWNSRRNSLDEEGWFIFNSGYSTHPVGQKKANKLGLYDMLGNVLEWCWDIYNSYYCSESPQDNPKGPVKGRERVLRGDSFDRSSDYSFVTIRSCDYPGKRGKANGVRLAKSYY